MSSEVKRYDPINSDGTCGMCIEDADYGTYVEYADYAALEAELAKLRAELEQRAVDGWKLVPVEPTQEMLESDFISCHCGHDFSPELFDHVWHKMLAAAPSAPKADDPVKQMLLEALEAIAAEDYKAPHDATDFAISFEKGLCIGRIKRTARAAIAAARKESKV